ncbi:hypothetical protein OB2597_11461 [Pseudooceanicola batsensis HTCC2597]|uniref:Methyltransferase domain-containing protein n=1 Tax=Pseudooceanicola batsensis (strain ATCC BAA-863 / DSM 15984 / KCTC 12145 / HTCC2597) TaxID=252305 RepID=A3TW62_PSEBH|nr:class I SAM-dependent methyltransferase [Pseudooceanicola batsensis]EAQ03858.1 hypothetical protein OB2597_11461 [Pseudooceanicola batsensis HTCC2597]
MSDARTIAAYDGRAGDYAAMTADIGEVTALRSFIAALPSGARVLDLGCGPGHAAAGMAEAGLSPDPVDASAEMVALARARGLPARQARFGDITARDRYDGIWANFSLLHAPRATFPGHLARLHRALRPRGLLHLGMKTGEGEARDTLGRFYTYYRPEELLGHLAHAGFTVTGCAEGKGKGLAGTVDPWCLVTAHA